MYLHGVDETEGEFATLLDGLGRQRVLVPAAVDQTCARAVKNVQVVDRHRREGKRGGCGEYFGCGRVSREAVGGVNRESAERWKRKNRTSN